MEALLFPILLAGCVMLATFGLVKAVTGPASRARRKLTERLSLDRPFGGGGMSSGGDGGVSGLMPVKSITLQTEVRGLPPFIAKLAFVQNLNRSLIQAWPDRKIATFLLVAGGVGVAGLLVAMMVSDSLLIQAIAAGGCGYVPFFLLASKRTKRQRILADQLPEGLDFLARILQAGHSFSTGLQMMGEELPTPLAGEFRRCYDQHSLGASVEDALKDMSTRIEATDFAFFVTAVMINRQAGGDLSEVLKNISHTIRQRMRLQQQVRAKTAEGRFTGYIMVAFPLVMFVIAHTLNPEYAEVLLRTSSGRMMLGVAGALQIMGLFAIKKITTVKV
jgi:tight adherence protein B